MSKISRFCGVDAEAVKALLEMELGELREITARLDADQTVEDFLMEDFEYDAEEYEVEEDEIDLADDEDEDDDEDTCYCEDDWEEDFDEEDECYEEEECEADVNIPCLTDEERGLADAIVDDIDNGHYTLDTIKAVYPSQIVEYVAAYVD